MLISHTISPETVTVGSEALADSFFVRMKKREPVLFFQFLLPSSEYENLENLCLYKLDKIPKAEEFCDQHD